MTPRGPPPPDLAGFLERVRTNNPNAHLTLLGHSYGSLTSSLALQELGARGLHPVNDAVFYGSPGLELVSPAQLALDNGSAPLVHTRALTAPKATVGYQSAPHIQAASLMRHH
ncbi:MAG: alpha/beta hydrolase [Mycobacterium sp.]